METENKININTLEEYFSNIVKIKNHKDFYAGEFARYTISERQADYFCFSNRQELGINLDVCIDNFPSQRMFFQSNFPITSPTQLKQFLASIGFNLELKEEPPQKLCNFTLRKIAKDIQDRILVLDKRKETPLSVARYAEAQLVSLHINTLILKNLNDQDS